MHLKLSLADPTHTTHIDHNVNMQEPNIRGFFHVPYAPGDPRPLEPSPPPDSIALFVGQRAPGEMIGLPRVHLVPGQQVSVQVVMQNLGTTTWTASGANPFRLGSQNPQDNTVWGTARVDLQGDVAPGAEATFDFDVTTPAITGTYTFQWRMVQEMVTWFGDFTATVPVVVQPAAAPPISDALFVSQRAPQSPVAPSQKVSVQVVMQNRGGTTWTPSGANPFRLGSQGPQDNAVWGTARVELQGDVAPGARATFNFDVTAPGILGQYNFQWRMVQEMVAWFGDSTPNIPVEVQPALPIMNVSVQPYPVPLVRPVSVTVFTSDAATGAPVAGSVLLDGVVVGTIGTPFLMRIAVLPVYDPEQRKWTEVAAPPVGTVTAPGYLTANLDFGVGGE